MAGRCLLAMKLPWCRPEFSQGKCLGEQLNTTSLSLSQFHLSSLPLFFSLQLFNTQTPKEGGEEDSREGEEGRRGSLEMLCPCSSQSLDSCLKKRKEKWWCMAVVDSSFFNKLLRENCTKPLIFLTN